MKKICFALISLTLLCACGNNSETHKNGSESKEEKNLEEFDFYINAIGNTMQDMKYDVKLIEVTAGSQVNITLVNKADSSATAMRHNIVFVKNGASEQIANEGIAYKNNAHVPPNNPNVIAYSQVAMPGETVKISFTAPEKGEYEFLCSYPGHLKMRGKFIVK